MAIKPDWTLGTLTLTAGSTAFTTTGSALKAADIQGGDTLMTQSGAVLVIETITGENSGTLYMPCPASAAGAAQPLRVRYQADGSRLPAATRHLLNELSSGNVAAFAELVGQADMVPIFTGTGMLTLVSTELVGGGGGSWAATVALLSGRDAFDDKPAGFRVLVIENGTNRSAVYEKTGTAAAAWSEPIYFTGPVGEQGIAATLQLGTVTTGAAGSDPAITYSGTPQEAVLNFELPASPTVEIGSVTSAPSGTAPSVTNSGSERAAVLNFVVPAGKDGTGTGDMQASDYDPAGKRLNVYDMASMVEADNAKVMTEAERQDIEAAERDRHTHDNKQALDGTTESFTTPLKSKLENLPANADKTNTASVGAALAAATGEQSIVDADSVAGVQSGTSNARRWTWGIVKAWIKGWITKADVGLPLVDNTSDMNKPISTAQGAAIGLKLDKTAKAADSALLNGQTAAQLPISTATQTALDMMPGVYKGSDPNEVNFPISHTISVAHSATNIAHNVAVVPRLNPTAEIFYALSGSGAILSGVWRARCFNGTHANGYMYLVERVG